MNTPVAPLQVDLARVVAVGTAAWGVALVVTAVLAAVGTTGWLPAVVCATGMALGFVGIRWAHRHDTMGRRLRAGAR